MPANYKLYAEIVPDISADFGQKAEAMMKRAMRGRSINTTLTFDKIKSARELKKTLRELEAVAELKVRVKFDRNQFGRELTTLSRSGPTMKVKTQLDRASTRKTAGEASSLLSSIFKGNAKKSLIDFDRVVSGSMTAIKVGAIGALPPVVALGGSLSFAATSAAAIGPALIGAAAGAGVLKGAFGETLKAFKKYQQLKEKADSKVTLKTKKAYQVTQRDSKGKIVRGKDGQAKKITKYKMVDKKVDADPRDALNKQQADFYDRLIKLDDIWGKIQSRFSASALPGFTRLIDTLGSDTDKNSFIGIFANKGDDMAKSMSNFADGLAKVAKDPEVKGSLATILDNDNKAFTNLGKAGTTALKPLLRIFAAASPLLVRLSTKVNDMAESFAKFIGKKSDADLAKYFRNAGTEFGKWWKVVGNVLGIVKNVLQLSAPSGSSLVDRLGAFTTKIKDFTASSAGQTKITSFFEYFQRLDYGKIGSTATNLTGLVGALVAYSKLKALSPGASFLTALTVLNPSILSDLASLLNDALTPALKFATEHETTVKTLTALFLAMKGLNSLRGINFTKLIPGLPGAGGKTGALGITPVSKNMAPNGAGNPIWVTLTLPDKKGIGSAVSSFLPKSGGGLAVSVIGIGGSVLAALGIKSASKPNSHTAPKTSTGNPWDYYYQNPQTPTKKMPWANKPEPREPSLTPAPTGREGIPWWKPTPKDRRQKVEDPMGKLPSWFPTTKNKNGLFGDVANTGVAKVVLEILDAVSKVAKVVPVATIGAKDLSNKLGILGGQATLAHGKLDTLSTSTHGLTGTTHLSTTAVGLSRVAMEGATTAAKLLAIKINGVPKTSKTQVTTPGLPLAMGNMKTLGERIDHAKGTKNVHLTTTGYDGVASSLSKLLIAQGALEAGISFANAAKKGAGILSRADGGHIQGPGTGTSDSIPARLSNGEYVIRARAVKTLGKDILDRLNHADTEKNISVAFKDGGNVTYPFPTTAAKTKIPAVDAGGSGVGGNAGKPFTPGYRNQIATLRNAGFNLSFSNSQLTGGGHVKGSNHYIGRAIDIGVGTNGQSTVEKVWQFLVSNYAGSSKELYWAQKRVNYRHGRAIGPTDKANHVHWAYKNGGLVDARPGLYDKGGMLKSGHAAVNLSGRPERVLNPEETRAYSKGEASATYYGGDTFVSFGDIHSDVDMTMAVDQINRFGKRGGF